MQCPNCHNQLQHLANFCPICGVRLVVEGEAQGEHVPTGDLHAVPEPVLSITPQNVVPLHPELDTPVVHPGTGAESTFPSDAPPVPAQLPPQVGEGAAVVTHPSQFAPGVHVDPASGTYGVDPSAQHSHGSVPPRPPANTDVRGRPVEVGDFFAEDDVHRSSGFAELDDEDDAYGGLRPAGTAIAALAVLLLMASFAVYVMSIMRGAAGADAGGIVVLSGLAWIWYLSLDRSQQHAPLLRLHRGMSGWLDARVDPFRARTEANRQLRREQQRFDALRDERARRVNALGEATYRTFRSGQLTSELATPAQRVLAIEQQMLLQDARLADLKAETASAATPPTNRSEVPADPRPSKPAPRRSRRRPRR